MRPRFFWAQKRVFKMMIYNPVPDDEALFLLETCGVQPIVQWKTSVCPCDMMFTKIMQPGVIWCWILRRLFRRSCDSAADRSKVDLWQVDYWARSRSCSFFFAPLTRGDRSGPLSKEKKKKKKRDCIRHTLDTLRNPANRFIGTWLGCSFVQKYWGFGVHEKRWLSTPLEAPSSEYRRRQFPTW